MVTAMFRVSFAKASDNAKKYEFEANQCCLSPYQTLEIGIEIGLDFDQSKQSSLNLRLVFFF